MENLLTPATIFSVIALPLCIGILLVWERILPNTVLPTSLGWYARVSLIYALQFVVLLVGELTWSAVFSAWALLNMKRHVAPWLGGLLAYFVWSFFLYWWHRWRHEGDWLWRVFHQLHHSPARLESVTSFFLHPIDYASHAILGTVVTYVLLGLDREAAIYFFTYSVAISFYIHVNIRVPRWTGYFIQTPDMHRVHHEYGKHRNNYADFVCWDMLFGTYQNPHSPIVRCGFDAENEQKFAAMLRG
jgi:sterol desaturase/sphingolipid hydroxylase (fatty acid hydroxylase superfamily)